MSEMTFQGFDKFQRKAFADRLTRVITSFSPFYDEAYVLSLNAKYGSGKTTFLQMWKNQLEDDDYKVMYINAWETDFDDEPIIPIVSALLNNITHGKGVKKLQKALHATLGVAALAVNNIVDHATGLNVHEIAKEVDGDLKAHDIQEAGKELYKGYSYKKNVYQTLRDNLSKYVSDIEKGPLIIFVDELDRVRPDYSVRFLEAIKHIFSLKGVCFVLAVDRKQLEASVRQLYGDIDFENYYLRFVTRETDLPETTNINLHEFIAHQGNRFFDKKQQGNLKFPFKYNYQQSVLNFIEIVSKAFGFTPRQIESLFRYFSQVMALSKDERETYPSWIEATIILCALFIGDRSTYKMIGRGVISPLELYQYFKKLDYTYPPHNDNQRYIIFTVLSCYMRDDKKLLQEIADVSLEHDGKRVKGTEGFEELRSERIRILAKNIDNFGSLSHLSPFQHIFDRMEDWREFFE